MFALGNLIDALARIADVVLTILYWFILIRVLLSWVNPDPFNPIVQFLQKVTEPILAPIRKRLPLDLKFGFDISPIIAFLIIMFLRYFLVRTLVDIAMRLR